MKKLTGLAISGIVAMLAPMLVSAMPILGGSTYLGYDSTHHSYQIHAEGYTDLMLTFSAIGGGSIDGCSGSVVSDCLSAGIAGDDILSGLSISRVSQEFSAALPTADATFDLSFDATITGDDETISIDWL
ncbi:MAG: hypothetical protein OEQ74_02355, partial [Gammaproteobacteria bacterium]|nr:hypothetical protein [Gammaproteobacteria bacterium]